MRKIAIAAVAAAVLTAASSAAQAASNTSQSSERAASTARDRGARDGQPLICIDTQITGSRLMRRICKTEREWQADGMLDDRRQGQF